MGRLLVSSILERALLHSLPGGGVRHVGGATHVHYSACSGDSAYRGDIRRTAATMQAARASGLVSLKIDYSGPWINTDTF
jgi:hypothetical protein